MADITDQERNQLQPHAGPPQTRRRDAAADFYGAAIACGLAPLIIGTGDFLVWLVVRSDFFVAVGAYTIYGGVLSVLVGFCLLACSATAQNFSAPVHAVAAKRRHSAARYFVAVAILLVNFPAAAFFAATASDIMTRYVVTIVNDAPEQLNEVVVSGGGVTIDFGSIAQGTKASHGFNIRADGELILSAKRGSEVIQTTIDGYVTNGIGADMEVVFDADGAIEVHDKRELRRRGGN